LAFQHPPHDARLCPPCPLVIEALDQLHVAAAGDEVDLPAAAGSDGAGESRTDFVQVSGDEVRPIDEPMAVGVELPARRALRPAVQRIDHGERHHRLTTILDPPEGPAERKTSACTFRRKIPSPRNEIIR
jgi:hypothetical protein